MIRSSLYRDPQPFDPALHRHKKVLPLTDYSVARDMHAVFVTAAEFPAAGLSFGILFVHTGERLDSGQAMVSPVALLGVSTHENLYVEGTRWDAPYVPAFIRRFPFLTAGVAGGGEPQVFVDAAWPGFNDLDGEALVGEDGKPTPRMQRAIDFLRQFDREQQRTREFCLRLLELGLLRELSMDADIGNGQTFKIQGILAVDEDRLHALPDADVLKLHRSGMLMLVHAHLGSLGNLRLLLERKARRVAGSGAAVAAHTSPAAAAQGTAHASAHAAAHASPTASAPAHAAAVPHAAAPLASGRASDETDGFPLTEPEPERASNDARA